MYQTQTHELLIMALAFTLHELTEREKVLLELEGPWSRGDFRCSLPFEDGGLVYENLPGAVGSGTGADR